MSNGLRKLERQKKNSDCEVMQSRCKVKKMTKQAMWYRCEKCGLRWLMWLELGLEEHGENHKPVPFSIGCKRCSGVAVHINWHEDIHLEEPREIEGHMSYFANRPDRDCGIPVM